MLPMPGLEHDTVMYKAVCWSWHTRDVESFQKVEDTLLQGAT